MKLFVLWRRDDYGGAIQIAREALAIAGETIAARSSVVGAEIVQLQEAVVNAEHQQQDLTARSKKVGAAAKEL
ncbi:MAG TPA: hypothetical protein VI794_02585 [Patescibacteria group bacterium]|nr:hypothetical protein [Patescibacteria group bacterium]